MQFDTRSLTPPRTHLATHSLTQFPEPVSATYTDRARIRRLGDRLYSWSSVRWDCLGAGVIVLLDNEEKDDGESDGDGDDEE